MQQDASLLLFFVLPALFLGASGEMTLGALSAELNATLRKAHRWQVDTAVERWRDVRYLMLQRVQAEQRSKMLQALIKATFANAVLRTSGGTTQERCDALRMLFLSLYDTYDVVGDVFHAYLISEHIEKAMETAASTLLDCQSELSLDSIDTDTVDDEESVVRASFQQEASKRYGKHVKWLRQAQSNSRLLATVKMLRHERHRRIAQTLSHTWLERKKRNERTIVVLHEDDVEGVRHVLRQVTPLTATRIRFDAELGLLPCDSLSEEGLTENSATYGHLPYSTDESADADDERHSTTSGSDWSS
ncbi:MAG: hypothetical protein MHM6MM_004333 [Cercozoa sp. M6MM]